MDKTIHQITPLILPQQTEKVALVVNPHHLMVREPGQGVEVMEDSLEDQDNLLVTLVEVAAVLVVLVVTLDLVKMVQLVEMDCIQLTSLMHSV